MGNTRDAEFLWVQLSEGAALECDAGRSMIAVQRWKEASEVAESFDACDPRLAGSLNNLGVSCRIRGELREAEKCYRRAMRIWKDASGWLDRMHLQPRARSTSHHLRMEQKYRKYYDRIALQKYRKLFPGGVAGTLNNLGELSFIANRVVEAQQLYEQALSARQGSMGEDEWGVARIRLNTAHLDSMKVDQASSSHNVSDEIINMSLFSSQALQNKWIIDSPAEFTDEGRLMAAILLTYLLIHSRVTTHYSNTTRGK